ncbi:glycosyl transferase family 90 [Bordetella genomosp. 13]|uniref:Lipopolysaccharide A protein n=1 Tax=Bordetella genomosp. 13 TaxID=463040 RepID=A0A1W6Z9G1_9BORD|nr:glycosyl transferase family 90 [Bordetella genomosp. 13]ARP93957.1 lipopolysaccharide A protein [Bordetella genomosp. 13]
MGVLPKAQKFRYYAGGIASQVLPAAFYRRRRKQLLATMEDMAPDEIDEIVARASYCNRLVDPFELDPSAVRIRDMRYAGQSAYFLDARRIVRHFDPDLRFSFRFGDFRVVPDTPTIIKSRPISRDAPADNANSVLLKLNQVRHFRFVNDPTPFSEKITGVVWRGKCYKERRRNALSGLLDNPHFDIGHTDAKRLDWPGYRPFMSIADQLRYKFVLSLEGNDVATNLKWIFSSNSLCFMPQPRYETWFMEGTLEPYVHYVPLEDDCSDMEEKMHHYAARPAQAEAIIRNAQRHVERFRNPRRELLVALLVMEKYFRLSGQAVA